MKNLVLACASILAFGSVNLSTAQTVLLTEDFETDGLGSRYTSTNVFASGTTCSDYFVRSQNGGAQCITNTINSVSGTFFWAGEDTDDGGNPSPPLGTLTLNPVSVAGYSTLEVKALLAIGRATGDRFETDDELLFQYNIDGGGWNTCGAFYGVGPFNSDLTQDTDLDGVADGVALTQTMTDYTFSVPATGTNMQVRFIMGNNGGTEEVIVDNIRIEGTIAASPEIDIEGNATSIADGDVTPSLSDDTDFGSVSIGATATNTFTIQNEGAGDLTLSGGPNFVSLSGSSLFTVTSQPGTNPISAAGSTTFQIQFSAACPNTAGTYTATVSVSSDDSDESPYTFDIKAVITGVDTDSDGALDVCDSDDDNDGVADGSDPDDADFNVCGDSDGDGCDDCSITNDGFGALSDSDPNNDGTDSDCDGICDVTDVTDGASQTRGNMLTFDGAADYVEIGNVAELSFGKNDDFTVEAWINSSSGSTAMQIISKYEGDLFNARGWGFQISSSSLAFYMAGADFTDLMVSVPTGSPNVKDGLWHHVAVVYDGSNDVTGCTFYIDGVAFAGVDGGGFVTTVAGTVTNTEVATIGCYKGAISGTGEFWDGSLDEVRVWDDVRTQTEIRENLHLSLSGGCDASLDGYWKFNETSGTTATDYSGNANDGTYTGAPARTSSQCAVGLGVSTTHSMTATATPYSSPAITAGYPMELTFATTPPGGEVVVTNIFGLPVGSKPGPVGADGSHHYWVVNNYGPTNSGLDGTMHLSYEDGHVATVSLAEYGMYKRGSRATTAWAESHTFASAASTVPGNNYIEFSPISSFSMFYEVSKTSGSALPVELLAFDANKVEQNDVLLEWSTASEIDNKGFAIQRSYDNVVWEEIAFVEGQGTKTTSTQYQFVDTDAGTGVVYYRLSQQDYNGESTLSEIRSVQLGYQVGDVTLYPNPNDGNFTITMEDGASLENAMIELIDPLGRIVERRIMSGNSDKFTLEDAKSGVYMVRIVTGDDQRVLRVVIK